MFRKLFAVGLVLMMLFVSFTPAQAISYGTPDGNAHPYVGSMVLKTDKGEYFQVCSGTLIAEKVFLTASHCTVGWDSYFVTHPGAQMLVTFDSTISPSGTYYTGEMITNPAYITARGADDPGDVAVILLDEDPGITPAQLPNVG